MRNLLTDNCFAQVAKTAEKRQLYTYLAIGSVLSVWFQFFIFKILT